MAYTVAVHSLAHDEVINAYNWYEDKQPNLGDSFLAEIDKVIAVIAEKPRLFPKVNRNFRKALVANFPFVIIFEYYPQLKTVHIASIRHMRRGKRGKFRRSEG